MQARIKHDIAVDEENLQIGTLHLDLEDGTKIHGTWQAEGGMGQGCEVNTNTTDVDEDEALALMEGVSEITVRTKDDVPASWVETGEWEGTVDWDEFRDWVASEMFDGMGR